MNKAQVQDMAFAINVEACNRLQREIIKWRDLRGTDAAVDDLVLIEKVKATAKLLMADALKLEAMLAREREAA